MNNDAKKPENPTFTKPKREGEELLKKYAQLAAAREKEEDHDHQQGCSCCQGKQR